MIATPSAFVPARGITHPYVQTAYGVFARRPLALPVVRERWDTPDGDFIDVDVLLPADGATRGFVVLVHGLEGSSRSPYMRGTLALAQARGYAGYALNFRSCSGADNRFARFYHSGDTADLDLVVRTAIARHPGVPGAVAGFSLGANVTVKWLGEQAKAAPDAIRGAVAVSCPFDHAACATHMDAPGNWWMRVNFLRTLKQKAIAKAARFPADLDAKAIRRATTFRAFDELVTAPLNGFRDADDYWRRASSKGFLGGIARPTLLISATDDPMIPKECIPFEAARANGSLRLDATTHGGHVGFVAGSAFAPRFWAEDRAMAFIDDLFARR